MTPKRIGCARTTCLWFISRFLPQPLLKSLIVRIIPRLLLLILPLCILLSGCQPKLKTDRHAERAHDLMMQARTQAGSAGADYRNEIWLEVIEELSQVSEQYANYDADLALMTEIKTMRSAAFLAAARAEDAEEDEQRQREDSLNEQIDRILANPFSRGANGEDLSEGGRWQVRLEAEDVSKAGGGYQVSGRVLNISTLTIERPIVMVDFIGRNGELVGTAQGTIEPTRIPPMASGVFRVKTRSPGIRKHRIVIRELSGSPLSLLIPDAE